MKFIRFSQCISAILAPLMMVYPLWAQEPVPANAAAPELRIQVKGNASAQAPAGSQSEGYSIQVTDAMGVAVPDAAVLVRLPDTGPSGSFAEGRHSSLAYTDATGVARVGSIQWGGTPGRVLLHITAVKGPAQTGMLMEENLLGESPTAVLGAKIPPAMPARAAKPPAPAQLVTVETVPKSSIAPPPQDPTVAHPQSVQNVPVKPDTVSVSSTPPSEQPHKSHAKWLILALVAAGAGAGVAMAGKGKSSGSAAPAPSLTINNPSISVGGH